MSETQENTAYIVVIDEQRHGPFDLENLRARLHAGELSLDTPVWEAGLLGWTNLG